MICVDKLFSMESRDRRAFFLGTRTGHRWCHMWSDVCDLDELHAFAAKLGLKRSWADLTGNLPHYDLVPTKRAKALKLGAVETDLRDWFRSRPFSLLL